MRPLVGAGQAEIATRSSTRTGAACGDETLKRKRAPSQTPAGTDTRIGWRTSEWPLPQQAAHGSVQTSPRPPQPRHSPRIGSSSGTIVPRRASRFDRRTSRVTVAVARIGAEKASRADRRARRPTESRLRSRPRSSPGSPRRSAQCRERQRSVRHEMDRVARSSRQR